MTLTFSYLESGATYEAQILRDGINANHDAEDYAIDKTAVNVQSSVDIHMASGGGFVIKLIKK